MTFRRYYHLHSFVNLISRAAQNVWVNKTVLSRTCEWNIISHILKHLHRPIRARGVAWYSSPRSASLSQRPPCPITPRLSTPGSPVLEVKLPVREDSLDLALDTISDISGLIISDESDRIRGRGSGLGWGGEVMRPPSLLSRLYSLTPPRPARMTRVWCPNTARPPTSSVSLARRTQPSSESSEAGNRRQTANEEVARPRTPGLRLRGSRARMRLPWSSGSTSRTLVALLVTIMWTARLLTTLSSHTWLHWDTSWSGDIWCGHSNKWLKDEIETE